jgi:3-phosphoshikimate 1-carboxyvinyltransferase
MNVEITPALLRGEVTLPVSKSEAHRIFIAAALGDRPVKICGEINCGDLLATVNGLRALGARINVYGDGAVVNPIKTPPEKARVDAGESGSTLRFLVPVAAFLGAETEFCGSERLSERPIKELIDALKGHGAEFSAEKLPFTVKGKCAAGKYTVGAESSSQFTTGLLLASGAAGAETDIFIEGKEVSSDYVAITIDVMGKFGVKVAKTEYGYRVFGGYKNPGSVVIGGDWSAACFFAAAGAFSRVILRGLDADSEQGDKSVLGVLKAIGAEVNISEKGIEIAQGEKKPFSFDAENCPDAVPALAALAAGCGGISVISGTERLKLKESDRAAETVKMLAAFGIKAVDNGDSLTVYGGKTRGADIILPNDHRIAMASAVLAAHAEGKSVLRGAECVKKSYPRFFEDFALLGGKVNVFGV